MNLEQIDKILTENRVHIQGSMRERIINSMEQFGNERYIEGIQDNEPVKDIRKECTRLTEMCTHYETMITDAKKAIVRAKKELEG